MARKKVEKSTESTKATKKTGSRKKVQYAVDHVCRLTERQSLMFGKLDAEMRNRLQGLKLIDYEIAETQRHAHEKITTLASKRSALQADVDRAKPAYEELMREIAQEHSIALENLLIDPDTGIVRDAGTPTSARK